MIRLICLFTLLPLLAFAAPQSAFTRIIISESNGVQLQAKLFLPSGGATAPAVVALHGCAGPIARRDDSWARLLTAQGHAVILPDSFASRGQKSECRQTTHDADAYGPRRDDVLAAATWLQSQSFAPKGGILLLGWSDGGTTILASIAEAPDLPKGLIKGAAAFYPACTRTAKIAGWHNAVPLLILIGARDDWTPPAPCQQMAARNATITVKLLPGAYHDFDMPRDPVHLITGLPYTKTGNGVAHAGENPAARAQALILVPAFFASLPSP